MSKKNSNLYWKDGEVYVDGKLIERKGPIPSSFAIQNSVTSDYDTTSARPQPKSFASFPAVNEPRKERSRYTTGYPNTLFGGASQGSSPTYDAEKHDHYRLAIEPKPYFNGYAKDSRFKQQYDHYKNLDAAAESSTKESYPQFHHSNQKYTKEEKRDNPGLYRGNPSETREWHDQAAEYAGRSAKLCDEAAAAREKMAHDFIGYDKPKSAKGHKDRVTRLRKWQEDMEEKEEKHRKFFKWVF